MWLSRSTLWIAAVCSLGLLTLSSVKGEEKAPDCTYYDEKTKNFYDLRPLRKTSGDDWSPETASEATIKLNVCHEILYTNTGLMKPEGIGAYFRKDVKGFSIGKANSSPFISENYLKLKYEDGDECRDSTRRRSTLIFFECDKSVKDQGTPEFLDQDDDCLYLFKWKTPMACPVAQKARSKLSGGAIFAIIMSVLAGVYWIGGILYKRVVMGQRGFNQLPNAEYWIAIGNFIKNLFRMVFPTCCANRSRRYNYNHLNTDEENVFIDEDEE